LHYMHNAEKCNAYGSCDGDTVQITPKQAISTEKKIILGAGSRPVPDSSLGGEDTPPTSYPPPRHAFGIHPFVPQNCKQIYATDRKINSIEFQ